MKHHRWAAALLASVVAILSGSPLRAAVIQIGTGPLISNFVLESPNIGLRTYAIHYDGGGGGPVDTYDLFVAVLAAEPDLDVTIFNFGTPSEPNYFINDITWDGVTETNTGIDPFVPTWVQWASGGESGFPAASPIPAGQWTLGSGISSPFRLIEPGSWDALVFADFSTLPSVVPVPEPQGVILIALGAIVLTTTRRHRVS